MSWAEAQYIIDETAGKVEEAAENLDRIATRIASGIPPQDMQAFSVTATDGGAKLKFTEPADTYIEGQRICSVKGVKIVMKQGGYPVNENDGTLVIDNAELGKYSSEALIIDGLENDTEYFICAFPYSDSGHYNRAAGLRVLNDGYAQANRARFTPQQYILYGYRRTKGDSNPATRLAATDMAVGMGKATLNTATGKLDLKEWANAWFVTGNKPVMMKYDGTVDYELNPDDYTKKTDGTASDVANSGYGGNAMALFPTCWVKRWQDSTYEYFQVCNIQLTEDFKAYAHQRQDGSIMEWFARSIYDGANVSNKIRSISGLAPCNTVAGNTQLTYAQANGSLWDCDTWSRVALIWDLLRLMALNDDVQTAYGYGYYTGMSQASHLKAAGTGNTKGQFYGKHANDVVKVFHLENFWGNIWKLLQGLVYNTTGRYGVKMCRPYNTSGSGYAAMSFGMTGTSGGYQSTHNMSEYGLLPTTVSGSDSTYIPDGAWFNTSQQNFARFGGHGADGLHAGCALVLNVALSNSNWHYGLGLTCEQPLAA
ncbi:MAG: hypothetical protein NC131_12285 [Roseburia sp.]|nr:hypothetical protein [Roseburia sp.]